MVIKENFEDLVYSREEIESELEKVCKVHLIRQVSDQNQTRSQIVFVISPK